MQYFYSGLALWIKYCATSDPCGFTLSFFPPVVFTSLGNDPLIRSLSLSAGIFFHSREKWQVFYFLFYFQLFPAVLEPCQSFTQFAWPCLVETLAHGLVLHLLNVLCKLVQNLYLVPVYELVLV